MHAALGLSVHASLSCTYEQHSNSLSGGVQLLADWWSRMRSSDENKVIRIAKCDVYLGACESF